MHGRCEGRRTPKGEAKCYITVQILTLMVTCLTYSWLSFNFKDGAFYISTHCWKLGPSLKPPRGGLLTGIVSFLESAMGCELPPDLGHLKGFNLLSFSLRRIEYRVAQNFGILFVCLRTSKNIDQFTNLFHSQNEEKICNNTITEDSTAPQVCRYTTLWNCSILKATTENKTTSVTTHFKSASSSSNAVFIEHSM